MLQITHDPGEGVAYVYLGTMEYVDVTRSEVIEGKYGTVVIDRDEEGQIVGVEFIA